MESPRRIRGLVASWVAYWTVLGITKLGPAAVAIWRATHGPEGSGNASLNYSDDAFKLTVNSFGRETYTGSVTLLALALWVAGPPLVAWLAWLLLARKEQRSREKVSS